MAGVSEMFLNFENIGFSSELKLIGFSPALKPKMLGPPRCAFASLGCACALDDDRVSISS